MIKIKSHTEDYECSEISKNVQIVFHSIEDKKKQIKQEGKMENCNSTVECGVKSESGDFDWNNCPIFGKTMKQIFS